MCVKPKGHGSHATTLAYGGHSRMYLRNPMSSLKVTRHYRLINDRVALAGMKTLLLKAKPFAGG